MPRLRARSTKKMSSDLQSVIRLRQTPTGVCGMRRALLSGFRRMWSRVHLTRRAGSFRNFSASSLEKAFAKYCLNGAMSISVSTRGQSWSLGAFILSSSISILMSRRSLSLRLFRRSMALCFRSPCFWRKERMVRQLPLAVVSSLFTSSDTSISF